LRFWHYKAAILDASQRLAPPMLDVWWAEALGAGFAAELPGGQLTDLTEWD